MFSQADITILRNTYIDALTTEYEAKRAAAQVEAANEVLRAELVGRGYTTGSIDGKNADTRKAGEAALLASNKDYLAALDVAANANDKAARAEIARKGADAELGLIKAWLYSCGRQE